MKLQLRNDVRDAIERLLTIIPRKTFKHAHSHLTRGDVVRLTCHETNRFYTATVRGGMLYEVSLQFANNSWVTECSCPVGIECVHGMAALMALRQRASPDVQSKPKIPPPPPSPLEDKLIQNRGRRLLHEETNFLRQVQTRYAQARARALVESDLSAMAAVPIPHISYWKQIEIWPEFPSDDFYFWLYVAWELQRRKVRWPSFMDGITDLSLIEPAMRAWERAKEIESWKQWFRTFKVQGKTLGIEPGVLDLRLALEATEARLQWRTNPTAPFAELKPTQARTLAEQFESGTLGIAPDSLPLWSATYKPWGYENWWVFKYSNATAHPALSRLLRMPLAPERVVTAAGQPLERFGEPLRLNLRPPENGDGNYELALTTAASSMPPAILCVLHGQPTLYLTEAGLFQGPSAAALDTESRKSIPAAAIETCDGLRFLHTTGVPLPAHLQERIRTVPVIATISCSVKPIYPGSSTENIVVAVTSKAPGLSKEKFTPRGWEPFSPYEAQKQIADEGGGTIRVHDRSAQKHFPGVLGTLDLKWEEYPGHYRLRLTRKTPEVFVTWLKSLPPEIEVALDSQLATLRDEPVSGTVSLDVTEAGIDWFDLKVALNVSDTTLSAEELKLLLNAHGGYVRLGKKGWRSLQFNITPDEEEQLARLGLHARDFSPEPQRLHALQLADDAAKKFLGPDRVEKIQRRVNELKTRVSPALPPTIRAEMRPYQTDGYHFLAYLTANGFGGVLADDMGLGKTLQTLTWLAWLRNGGRATTPLPADSSAATETAGPPLPSLVVCPKSVMDNWRAEAERFYPDLRVRLWRGEPATELSTAGNNAELIVVNFAQLRLLSPAIAETRWLAAVLDEAQHIKNPDSQTAQAARALNATHRLALTGTPIENRLLDLWSIFGFAMPGALGNRAHFLRRFDAKGDPLARRRLAARVRPFLLRRTKGQVAKDLPDRVEEDLLCEMEGQQQTLYRAELKRARQIVLGLQTHAQLNAERFNILTSLLRLRQICCHPALVDNTLIDAESAKVDALEDLLEPLMAEGHKVLVFSQFVTMLDLLRALVKKREWPHFYLAGDTENRGDLVQSFQSAEGGAVFLLSLKAGGFGLNLTAASYVVLFDPWWNPAVENQAIDRTHRIGQTSNVMAYRLLMRDSIEQKIRLLQKQKAALAQDVLGEERFAHNLTLNDLRFLFAE